MDDIAIALTRARTRSGLPPAPILCLRSAAAVVDPERALRYLRLRLDDREGIDAQCPHDGWTALHWTVWRQNVRGVQFLLDNGASPRLADMMHRRTPLHWAAVRGDATIVKALLNAGNNIDIDALDGFGLTTFQIALDCNQSRGPRDAPRKRGATFDGARPAAELERERVGVRRRHHGV